MTDRYGEEQVEFFVVDKDNAFELTKKYGVRAYPSFVYVKPGTNAHIATKYSD